GGVDIEHLVLRLYQADGRRFGAVLGPAVDGIDQILVDEVFRREFEALGVAAFPGGGAQVAGGYFTFAGIKLGHLTEPQRIAVAGVAVEIVENAPAHPDDLRAAARLTEREIVDGAVRHQYDWAVLRAVLRFGAGCRRGEDQCAGKESAARCEAVTRSHEPS